MIKKTILLLALSLCVDAVQAKELHISNETVGISYDDTSCLFTLVDKASNKVFVKDGKLNDAGELLRSESIKDKIFGAGMHLVIAKKRGGELSLEVYPNLPFALVRDVSINVTKEILDISSVVPAVFTLDLGKSVKELQTMGTGGLLSPDKSTGSYLFLTVAHPETRNGVVTGWLTQDRGCGVVIPSVKGDAIELNAQIDYGHLLIPAGKSAALETLAIGYFKDARLGQEAWADAIKKQYTIDKLHAPDAVYSTWVDDVHPFAGDEVSMVELSHFVAKELKEYGLRVLQVDDHWQGEDPMPAGVNHPFGPYRGFDKVDPSGPYSHGIAPVAKKLAEDGITMGLWWMPFGRTATSEKYAKHQDWFMRLGKNGDQWDGNVFDTSWGGTALDLTHPEVQAELADLSKQYKKWGVGYYKMDGLYMGIAVRNNYVNNGYWNDHMERAGLHHDPFKTQIESYRDGLKLIRQNAGKEIFLSGCTISQNMYSICAMGLFDAMRIGPDFPDGDRLYKTGPLPGTSLYFLNGRVWWNDTDPCKVGNDIPLELARLNASWLSLSGQLYFLANWLPALKPEKLDVVKRTLGHHNGVARPVDTFDRVLPNTWLISDDHSGVHRDVIGVYNFEKEKLNAEYSFEKLGLNPTKTYYAFDYWQNMALPEISKTFKADCESNACRVISLRAKEGHPILVSTSRHVSSGILEVKQEQWKGKTLSGTSDIIANDPYELRIMGLNDGGKQWKVSAVELSTKDREAGVKIEKKVDGKVLRITISSPTTRTIQWSVVF